MRKSFNQRVWELVSAIPQGRVASYGQLASMLGHPRRARQVGFALHQTPEHLVLPWHRVINSKGQLSFSTHSEQYMLQKAMLEAEKVRFTDDGHIDFKEFGWRP